MASSAQTGSMNLLADQSRPGITTSVGFLVVAGVLNALIAAWILCKLPNAAAPSLGALLLRAFLYVCVALLAGLAGAGFYWRRSSKDASVTLPLCFVDFALVNAAGWVWAPALIFLSRQDSWFTALFSALGIALLAVGLRRAMPAQAGLLRQPAPAAEWTGAELFAASLESPRREAHGYLMALSIYAAAYLLLDGANFVVYANLIADTLLALCAFALAWKLTLVPDATPTRRRAALRLVWIALAAVLVTVFVLYAGVESRNRAAAMASGTGMGQGGDADRKPAHPAQNEGHGIAGYESIILWPVPEKKQILAPVPIATALEAARESKLQVIRFDGVYWYYQPPGRRPGANAHLAIGTPLAIDIHSNDELPLTMEAHQKLDPAVRLARCGAIKVSVESHDSGPGTVRMGVLLSDSTVKGRPALYLGQQLVSSHTTEQVLRQLKPAAAFESLRFAVPASARMRQFDEITVIFFPDEERAAMGAKIAVQQFELLPR